MIRFFDHAEPTGKVAGSIPEFRNVLMIEVVRSATSRVVIPAKDKHIEAHAEAYAIYERDKVAREGMTGFPIAAWPSLSASDRAMCEGAGLFTVEALAEADLTGAPVALIDAQDRARSFLNLLAGTDTQSAALVDGLEAEVAALKEQLSDANATVKELRVAAKAKPTANKASE